MIQKFYWHYFYIFIQADLLELPVYYFAFKQNVPGLLTRSLKDSERFVFFLIAVTAISSLTHPLIFFGIMNLKMSYLANVVFAEVFKILSEGFLMSSLLSEASKSRTVAIAMAANLVSWQLGPLLTFKIFA